MISSGSGSDIKGLLASCNVVGDHPYITKVFQKDEVKFVVQYVNGSYAIYIKSGNEKNIKIEMSGHHFYENQSLKSLTKPLKGKTIVPVLIEIPDSLKLPYKRKEIIGDMLHITLGGIAGLELSALSGINQLALKAIAGFLIGGVITQISSKVSKYTICRNDQSRIIANGRFMGVAGAISALAATVLKAKYSDFIGVGAAVSVAALSAIGMYKCIPHQRPLETLEVAMSREPKTTSSNQSKGDDLEFEI